MNTKIKPFNAHGEIVAPPSKSFAHRYIISAFLSGKRCLINNVGNSDDVKVTISALESLGGIFEKHDNNITFLERKTVKKAKVFCGESGSTLRFLFPVCSALGINAEFSGKGKLMDRPISDLLSALNGHGAIVSERSTKGKLTAGTYVLDASLSSQFVTGIMFALSILNGESEIIIKGDRVSKGYIDITLSVLSEFGVNIAETDKGYRIIGGYNSPDTVNVEGDWSGSAFPLSIGAITGKVTVSNLKYPSLQSDSQVFDILKRFGAKVSFENGKVTVEKNSLKGIDYIDCENIPDIAQVICSVSAFAEGKTVLKNVLRLKIKESNRIDAIIKMLSCSGIKVEFYNDTITVYGGKPHGSMFDGGKDHRTVMSSSVIACGADGVSEITDIEYVNKSYTDFYNDLKLLGLGENDV